MCNGGKMFVIVVYDICMDENGSSVLQAVFKTCKKYLYHFQHSVFIGELTEINIIDLECQLKKVLRNKDNCSMMKIKNTKNLIINKLTGKEFDKFNII